MQALLASFNTGSIECSDYTKHPFKFVQTLKQGDSLEKEPSFIQNGRSISFNGDILCSDYGKTIVYSISAYIPYFANAFYK